MVTPTAGQYRTVVGGATHSVGQPFLQGAFVGGCPTTVVLEPCMGIRHGLDRGHGAIMVDSQAQGWMGGRMRT